MAIRGLRSFVVAVSVCVVAASSAAVGATAGQAASRVPAAAGSHHHVHGDIDGDGRRDLVVAAPGGNRVRVSYSHAKPGGSHLQWLTPPETGLGSSYFGGSLAIGDFNGDGFTDLAVGAPSWTNTVTVGTYSEPQGAVYIYRGSKTGLHYSGFVLHGPYDGDGPHYLGDTLASTDINKDGFADLALTVSGGDNKDIHVLYGSSTGLRAAGEQDFDDYGVGALAFGDVNHNGFPDLVLGDTTDLGNPVDEFEGDVQVIYGHASGLNNAGRQKISGNQIGLAYGLGQSVAVGDLNHDGYADVVVGDPTGNVTGPNPGKIVIFLGGKHGISRHRVRKLSEKAHHLAPHTGRFDLFGWSVAIGSMTGDKYQDVVVGAPGVRVGSHQNAGAVYVLRGTKSGVTAKHAQRLTEATHGVPGNPQKGAKFGSLVHLSLLSADQYLDLVIAAPTASPGVHHGGFFATLRGSAHGVVTQHAKGVPGSTARDELGIAIAG